MRIRTQTMQRSTILGTLLLLAAALARDVEDESTRPAAIAVRLRLGGRGKAGFRYNRLREH